MNFYADHNATAPLGSKARTSWEYANRQYFANPSSPHRAGKQARHVLEKAREQMAAHINKPAENIVWTSGATEANNTVMAALAPEKTVLVSEIEHPSMKSAARRWGQQYIPLEVTHEGVVDMLSLITKLKQGVKLVAVMDANNLTGVIQPIETIARECEKYGATLISDITQSVGRRIIDRIPAQWVTGSFHKAGGLKGTGFLAGDKDQWPPLLVGGGQEKDRRSGTENVPGIVASVDQISENIAATAQLKAEAHAEAKHDFETEIKTHGIQIAGDNQPRLWNTTLLGLPPRSGSWISWLDRCGIAAATGSACSSSQNETASELKAIQWAYPGQQTVRISIGLDTPVEFWQELTKTIHEGLER